VAGPVAEEKVQAPVGQVKAEAPKETVVVGQDVLIVFMDEPEHHFERAKEAVLKKDMKTAAAEVRKSEAFLKLQAARAGGEGKKALDASVEELEKLSKELERSAVTSADKLSQPFARAHHAMARHHHQKASESWANRLEKRTGHDLDAAGHHLERAMKWSGQEAERGTDAVIKDARLTAGKLIEGVRWAEEEVRRGLASIGEEVRKLGKKM
jgi:hypothetical protein